MCINEGYLSRDNTKALKGILAICILVHHLYINCLSVEGSLLAYINFALGYFAVALFFFLSGYGLMASFDKDEEYLSKFLKTKIIPFYCIIVILTCIYLALRLFLKQNITFIYVLRSLTFTGTNISNGWYLYVQLVFYILFLIAGKCSKKYFNIILFSEILLYIFICCIFSLDSILWERSLAFPVGVLWYQKKQSIDSMFDSKKKWILALFAFGLIFCAVYLLTAVISIDLLNQACRGISSVLFIPLSMLLLMRIRIDFKLTRFLGSISLAIYVIQGAFMMLFHSEYINVQSPVIYIIINVVCTIVVSLPLTKLFNRIYSIFRTKEIKES